MSLSDFPAEGWIWGMSRKKPIKKFRLHMKKTLIAVMFICVLTFIVLIARIFMVIEDSSDKYTKKVLSQQTYVNKNLLYKRGEIVDRNGTALAISVKVYDLVISPKDILENDENKEFTLSALVQYFELDRTQLEKLINDNAESQYRLIDDKKGLTADEIAPFQKAEKDAKTASSENNKISKDKRKSCPIIKGVWFEERYARKYPLANSSCNIIGFADGDTGNNGIEEYYNSYLTGSYGREYGYFDSELNLQRTVKPAVDGNTVVSSIDANVQRIVEEKITEFQQEMGGDNVAVMIMNPQNGEILAMSSDKMYDLNNPRSLASLYTEQEVATMSEDEKVKALSALWKNFCISNTYEPGSTFKTFTVAAALDEGTTDPSRTYVCNGKMQVGIFELGCANRVAHGIVTPEKALMASCNVTLMQIAAELGRTQFYRYMNIYGFGSKTGIDLTGEEKGIIHSEEALNVAELATSSFGQTQNVTMIQMMSAFCSLINGGYYYAPHVVKEIRNEQGAVVESMDKKILRQTITTGTSDLIREYLKATVESGTATAAQVKGYEIGGKTGTAEKHPIEDKNYIVSFIGFTPIEKPQVAIYVLIDQPHIEDQAHSTYATEFAAKIMKDVLPFLNVYIDSKKE